MKRYLSIILLAIAAFVAAPQASAYNEQIAELAKMLNDSAASEGCSVTYDGNAIIMNFPPSMFTEEEIELFAIVDDLQPLASTMVQGISQIMTAEDMYLFGTILSNTDTNFIVRLQLGDKGSKDIMLTGQDFLNK